MRVLTMRQVQELVLYSRPHINRLVDEGRFPQPIKLGEGRRGRIGWIEQEVLDWLQERIDRRAVPTDSSR